MKDAPRKEDGRAVFDSERDRIFGDSVQREILPRKRRLEALLTELDAP